MSTAPTTGTTTGTVASERFSVLAIVGFVLAFIVNIAGLVVSIIAVVQINRTGERGKGLAIAGIIISILSIVLGVLFSVSILGALASNPALQQ